MKKTFLFFLFSIGLLSAAEAQVGSRWYSYADYVSNVLPSLSSEALSTSLPIWNDTTTKFGYPGTAPVYQDTKFTSVGMSFAPRLAAWDNAALYGSAIKVGPTDAFTIDSVRVHGVYLRNNSHTSPKDTIRLGFVYGNGSTTSNIITLGVSAVCFGFSDEVVMLYDSVKNTAGRNPTVGTSPSPYITDIILSNTDTSSNMDRAFPVSFAVPAGQIASMSLSFKSGDPLYVPNDTVRYASGAYKYGAFTPYIVYNGNSFTGAPECPISDVADSNVGYFKMPGVSWGGYYIPTMAWGSFTSGPSVLQYPHIDYHINCPTCRLNDTISGASAVCHGGTTTLSHSLPGGTWASSNPSVATIGSSSGIVNGITSGTTTITYNISGHVTTSLFTVDTTATAGAISTTTPICAGFSSLLSDPVPGGTWVSSNPFVAEVFGGTLFGDSPGTATISYIVTNSCGTATATVNVTVNPSTDAGIISGPSTLCAGATTTLTETVSGGTWMSFGGGASVSSTGVVTAGMAEGFADIEYSVTGICGTGTAFLDIEIIGLPDAGAVTGTDTVCIGNSISLSDPIMGGTWSASNGNVFVSTSGVISGISAGTAIITYTVTNICGNGIADEFIRVVNCSPSDVQNIPESNGIAVYPNPTSDKLVIASASPVRNVIVSNMMGQVVFSGAYERNNVEISLGQLAAGIYSVKVNNDKVFKVSKQ